MWDRSMTGYYFLIASDWNIVSLRKNVNGVITNMAELSLWAQNIKEGAEIEVSIVTDDDGEVTVKDLIRLKKYLAGSTVSIDSACTVMDEDGYIEADDMILLHKNLLSGK